MTREVINFAPLLVQNNILLLLKFIILIKYNIIPTINMLRNEL